MTPHADHVATWFSERIHPGRHVNFRYLATSDGATIANELAGFSGMLQADAAATYHETLRRETAIIEVGCWAHARRNFFEALGFDRERALIGIGFIADLYDAHRGAMDAAGVVDGPMRKMLASPVLDRLMKWTGGERPTLTAPSPIERALGYLERHWIALTRFLDDGRLRLDNNPSELELRHQVVGRKNWLFCATDGGATWRHHRDAHRQLPHPRHRAMALLARYAHAAARVGPHQGSFVGAGAVARDAAAHPDVPAPRQPSVVGTWHSARRRG